MAHRLDITRGHIDLPHQIDFLRRAGGIVGVLQLLERASKLIGQFAGAPQRILRIAGDALLLAGDALVPRKLEGDKQRSHNRCQSHDQGNCNSGGALHD